VLEKILVPAGTEDVAVGAVIALIAGEGEAAAPAPPPISHLLGSKSDDPRHDDRVAWQCGLTHFPLVGKWDPA